MPFRTGLLGSILCPLGSCTRSVRVHYYAVLRRLTVIQGNFCKLYLLLEKREKERKRSLELKEGEKARIYRERKKTQILE